MSLVHKVVSSELLRGKSHRLVGQVTDPHSFVRSDASG